MPDAGRQRMRYTWRRVLAFVASLLVALSCTGPKPPEGRILIEFWDFPRLPGVKKWQEDLIEEYNRTHPEVYIHLTRLSWAKGGERLDIAAFAGRPPDIAGGVFQVKYVEAGILAPLDDYLDEPVAQGGTATYREDIYPKDLRSVQWQGKTWAFPWYREGFVILLNLEILAERGVKPPANGQWTWEEFLAAMHRLTYDRDGDGRTDVYGIGFNTGREKWEAYPFLFAEGMEILSDDGRKCLLDSEATRRGLRRLLELEYQEKVSLPGAGGIQDDTTWTAFSGRERRLATTCQGLWAVNAVVTQNQRLEEMRESSTDIANLPAPLRVGIAMFPQMPGQPQRMASYGVGSLMIFNRPHDPRRTNEAARFARYMTLEVGQQINSESGLLPIRRSAGNLYEGDSGYDAIMPFAAESITPPPHPAWRQLDQVIGDNIQLVLLKRVDVDTAVTKMAERCQLILDDYWKSADAGK